MQESEWDETVIFDRAHLKAFTSGDPFFEKQVIDIFIGNAPLYLDELFSAPHEAWAGLAHKLKGAARGIGAWRLARASERAEHAKIQQLSEEEQKVLCEALSERMLELLKYLDSLPKDDDGLLL